MVKYTENLLQFWTDLILLNKSPNSGRVKIKIAKVTNNGTRAYPRKMDIIAYFGGSHVRYLFSVFKDMSPRRPPKPTFPGEIFGRLKELSLSKIHPIYRPNKLETQVST